MVGNGRRWSLMRIEDKPMIEDKPVAEKPVAEKPVAEKP
jgi:hypothetical protein